MPKADIAAAGYDLSLNRYKEVVHEEVQHRAPKDILADLEKLEAEIQRGLKELEGMLGDGELRSCVRCRVGQRRVVKTEDGARRRRIIRIQNTRQDPAKTFNRTTSALFRRGACSTGRHACFVVCVPGRI